MRTMEKRKIGRSPLEVSAVGLGLMSMSGVYGNANDEESISLIHYALDKGINLLDSADMYGWGHNEQLLGRALKGWRDKAIVATKFGQTKDASGKQGVDGRPEYVRKSCEASLKRLGIDVIDLYYQHRVDPNTPIEETVGAMAALVQEGKIRHIGLSEASAKTLRRAAKVHAITALQSEYSLWSRDPEDEILATCRDLGIGFVAYSPLGRGVLTGQIKRFEDFAADDYRRFSPRFQGENFQKNLDLVGKIEELAERKGCTPSQLALAWVLAQGEEIVPIPGTKRRKYLEENVGALNVKLTVDDLLGI